MANNNLTNDILVKVDQNNLIYIDPNSVVSNGNVNPRMVEHENLVMYVNLEADLIPRSTLVAGDNKNTLLSIAKGTLNFMRNKNGRDYDTRWTDTYTNNLRENSVNESEIDSQGFGIESVTIQVAGANFIPRVNIRFIDVRGKVLFESPENSPYGAFFHLPWPIFYLTVKGYYGKAIRYRLHLIKFNSKYNASTGNFEVDTIFVGSTYAYLADISLQSILNAPYMFASESETITKFNEQTGYYDKTINKSTKGYRILKSVYQEYVNKGLLPSNFPVKTLKEIIVIAGRLNKLLESSIFSKIINPKILAGVKDFEDKIVNFENQILAWKAKNLSPVIAFDNGTNRRWFELSGTDKNKLEIITSNETTSLEKIILKNLELLEVNPTFGTKRDKTLIKSEKIKLNVISTNNLKNIKNFYEIYQGKIGVDIDSIIDEILTIQRNFVEQRNILEETLEKEMNNIVKSDVGLGFEPTVRNIIGVVLANAETYIRLMKDVHNKAFEYSNERKKLLQNVLTDSDLSKESIYPWPEIKLKSAGGKELILAYPGTRELTSKLQTNTNLWPEIDFVENFYEISTKRQDNIPGKEGSVDNINYVFNTNIDASIKDISVLTNLVKFKPYTDKSISSILYEIYERAKYTTSLSPFSDEVMTELANVEFENIKNELIEDIDAVEILKKNIINVDDLFENMISVSPFDRYPYYQDQLPTVDYIKNLLNNDFTIKKYVRETTNTSNNNNEYIKLNEFITKNYKPESYRKSLYPFNSTEYLSYLNQETTKDSNLLLNGFLSVDTPENFISSPIEPAIFVKDGFENNLFLNTITIGGVEKHILNTPYFHKILYEESIKTQIKNQYVGSSYILLNSLPFFDLSDTITYNDKSILMSTLFKEIGASHHIPYHLMIKWGSIYHRYKRYVIDGVDILNNITLPINGDLYYDYNLNRTYIIPPVDTVSGWKTITRGGEDNIGFNPFYQYIYHNIVNNYTFFNFSSGSTGYSETILSGITKIYDQPINGGTSWTVYVDNSKFDSTDLRYTLLPSNGYNIIDGSEFYKSEQENYRIIWDVGVDNNNSYTEYSGYTFPSYNEYLMSSGGTLSMDDNYKKLIDLIAVFKPDILDLFEDEFLNFSSGILNEETPFKKYDVKYTSFQTLLKKITSVTKKDTDNTETTDFPKTIKNRQLEDLQYLTNEILSNDNLIKIILSNPREIDNYVIGGFCGVDVRYFELDTYNSSQLLSNQKYIELYLGEDIDGYYLDFFTNLNIELSEENIKQFRPLIYYYAGLRKDGNVLTKDSFIDFIKNNIIYPNKQNNVNSPSKRLGIFLTQVIRKIQDNFSINVNKEITKIKRGYNDDPIKLELYNYFKSFNDKWTAGNSIGQRTLMEEFLFLDKANKDIGSSVYLDMERLISLGQKGNEKTNLYGILTLLIQNSGFDIRALPAYVNFYKNDFSSTNKITPSKNVAENMFGTFLEVDYEDSSPKIILQYIGPTSKHLEMSDINNKYKYKNDGFDVGDTNNNPIIVASDIFTKSDLSKSNKVVAFEVSIGDQNQSIFKSVDLDQSTIKNTSESFIVIERLGQNEAGSSTAQIDVGLFDIYKQASYSCQVTSMGNVMIQPTMYFYLKNVPLFRGTYWITEVSHSITSTGIETTFKGSRIPAQSLPDPQDSFLASYRNLFDRLVKKSIVKTKNEDINLNSGTSKTISNNSGDFTYDMGEKTISNEKVVQNVGITEYRIPYNGYEDEKYIQLIEYNGEQWLRSVCLLMGGKTYTINDNINMSIVSKLTTNGIDTPISLTWGNIKNNNQDYYSTKFYGINSDFLINNFTETEFYNPKENIRITIETNISSSNNTYNGPVNVGPSINGYGIGLSKSLMDKLKLYDGDVIYFRLK